jgi:hypothetical protein
MGSVHRLRFQGTPERDGSMCSMDDVTLLSWIGKGETLFTLLVAIGVAGEFASTLISRPIRARVEAQRAAEIALLNVR